MANHENQNQEEVFTNDNNSIKPEIGIEIDGTLATIKLVEKTSSLKPWNHCQKHIPKEKPQRN